MLIQFFTILNQKLKYLRTIVVSILCSIKGHIGIGQIEESRLHVNAPSFNCVVTTIMTIYCSARFSTFYGCGPLLFWKKYSGAHFVRGGRGEKFIRIYFTCPSRMWSI